MTSPLAVKTSQAAQTRQDSPTRVTNSDKRTSVNFAHLVQNAPARQPSDQVEKTASPEAGKVAGKNPTEATGVTAEPDAALRAQQPADLLAPEPKAANKAPKDAGEPPLDDFVTTTLARLMLGQGDAEEGKAGEGGDTAAPAPVADNAAASSSEPSDLALLSSLALIAGQGHAPVAKGSARDATTTTTTASLSASVRGVGAEAKAIDGHGQDIAAPVAPDEDAPAPFALPADDRIDPALTATQQGGSTATASTAAAPVQGGTALGVVLSDRVIDMGLSGQWIDDVAKEISRLAASDGSASFRMAPPNLGAMRIDVRAAEDAGTQISMTVETEAALHALRSGADMLASEARHSGLRLAGLSIEQADPASLQPQPTMDPRHVAAAGQGQSAGDRPAPDQDARGQSSTGGQTGAQGQSAANGQTGQSGQSASDRQNAQYGQLGGKVSPQGAVLTDSDNATGQSPPAASPRNARYA